MLMRDLGARTAFATSGAERWRNQRACGFRLALQAHRTVGGQGEPAFAEPGDSPRVHAVFFLQDAGSQARLCISRKNRHCDLCDDRAAVEGRTDEVHSAAMNTNTRFER